MSEFKKEDKKGGFLASLSNLFGGGSSAAGGASGLGGAGGLGGASGLGGLFATKAGIMGMVLGGATIAAGVGVVYNFIGPSSKPVYNPQLFQDTYYEEQANNAGLERAQQKEGSAAPASTLDMFREQAKKDGLGMDGAPAAGANKAASADAPAVEGAPADGAPAAGASADAAVNAPAGGGGKLQAASGFGGGSKLSGGGSSSSNAPKLSGGGGMFGGINGQFSPVYKPPVGKENGRSGAMKGSMAAAVKNSPKYSVPNFNKKGAFGQAKFAGNMGNKSAQGPSLAGSKTGATEAFSGETAGSGDVTAPGGGAGLGGAGISSANKLKSSDPSINSNESTPPKVAEPENVSPWTKYTDMAMYGMLAAALLIFIAGKLAEKGKACAGTPAAAGWFMAAKICAVLAMAAAAAVLYAGMKLKMGDPNGNPPWTGQNWTGIMYMVAGGMLMYKAYQAFAAAEPSAAAVTDASIKAAETSTAGDALKGAAAVQLGSGDAKTPAKTGK